jgi:hypothetical protein
MVLLLSSYSPLFLIAAIRMECEQTRQCLIWLGTAFTLLLVIPLLATSRSAPEDYKLASVENASGEVAAYVATYILPLLVVSDTRLVDLAAYAVVLMLIGLIMIRGELLHYNPWIFILGRTIHTVRMASGRTYYLVAKRHPQPGSVINARAFAERILLES